MRKRTRRIALVLVGSIVVTAATSTRAPATTVPPAPTIAPTITSGPTGTTDESSATFTYTHPQAGVTFRCALNGGSFSSCSSRGITYSRLRDGVHTFRVAVRSGGSALGPIATRTWTVDRNPPSITIVEPPDDAVLDATAWSALCDGRPGACGTAADATGVAEVRVAILRTASGRYWNGTTFAAVSPQFLVADGTTSWHLALPQPPDGRYLVFARGRDALGNQAPASVARSAFTIDTTPLDAPVLTSTPDEVTTSTSATFRFTLPPPAADAANARGSEGGNNGDRDDVGFECALDDGTYRSCASPQRYRSLSLGNHCFAVQAVNRAGRRSEPARWCWWVIIDRGFPLAGDAVDVLFPGTSSPVDLRITNPYPFALKVLSVTTTVREATSKPGCSGTQNLVVTDDLDAQPIVPPGETRSLSELGIDRQDWPKVTMPNLPTNQDACKLATFALTYAGTATKA